MRAVLVVNPKATGTTARTRDVLAAALAADLKVEVAQTERRGHAVEIARSAAQDRVDYVIALGGDGTLNEVVNGLLSDGVRPDAPAVGIVPGGCTNVFARSLGLPTDPVEATSVLLEAIRAGRTRSVGLGRADDRWFTFCAGLGIDAGTVQRVERRRKVGTRVTPWRYARAAIAEYFLKVDHGDPALVISRPGVPDEHAFIGLVCNTAPWTYLGDRPVNPCPDASFDTGLDLFALTRMRPLPTLRVLAQLFGKGPHGKRVIGLHDLEELTIRTMDGIGTLALQVDGDYLGPAEQVHLRAVPRALRVLAPADPA